MTSSCSKGYFNGMKFTLDARAGVNLIRAYSPTELHIGSRIVIASCIVTADTLITEWRSGAVPPLSGADLAPLFALEPQIVLWGCGRAEQAPSPSVRAAVAQQAMVLEVMDLGAACRTFNILVQEERRVAAALFL